MRPLVRRFLTPGGPIGRIALALFFVAAALALTLGLREIAARVHFFLFVPAVMFSTWFGGLGAGMLASILTVGATVLLLPPAEVTDQLAWLIMAAVVTFGTSALTGWRRREDERLLARALEEQSRRRDAEALSELKTEVLMQVVHEFRQPLSAMSAAIRVLEAAPNDGARQRTIGVIDRQTEHLRHLVDDLLDLSRITRHDLALKKSTFDLCEIVEDALHVIATDVAARRLGVSSSLPPCPVRLTADATRVRQILSNLLSNAVKFTPDGGTIDLLVELKNSHVVIRVRDTGRGIAPETLPRIFEMFHKSGGDGLGVGLAVVKGLVELHGGSVAASSDGPGHGSEFVVTLPAVEWAPA